MKIIAINGSRRRSGNSAAMLKSWVDGVKSAHPNVETQWVDLYSLAFTGCRSCFHCKRIDGKYYGQCPIKDGIHDLISAVYAADAVCISCPIYFDEPNAYTRCFLERALFCKTTYRANHPSLAPKPVPVTMIYTMNYTEGKAVEHNYQMLWDALEQYVSNAFRYPVKRVCAYNAYQFSDYTKYAMEIFQEEEKRRYRDTNFSKDIEAAFLAGKNVIHG